MSSIRTFRARWRNEVTALLMLFHHDFGGMPADVLTQPETWEQYASGVSSICMSCSPPQNDAQTSTNPVAPALRESPGG